MIRYLQLTVLVLFTVNSLSGQSNSQQAAQQEKRIALVIGNGNYSGSVLANPENDSRSMTDVLRKLGFTVYPYENLNAGQMKRAIDDFGAKLKSNDVGLFYYAGHGIQAKGYNYLIPVDAQLNTEEQVEYDCVRADRVLALMETSGTKVNVIILDACRNNPFERSWTRSATGKGLAFMSAPKGTLIAYATAPGSTASDGSGKNGLYTSAILESIIIPNITIEETFKNVRNIVAKKSQNQQIPWESTSLTGDFYFYTNEIDIPKNQEKVRLAPVTVTTFPDEIDFIIDSRDRQRYKIMRIGNQVWMAENLKTTKFNDGTDIPLVTDGIAWSNLITPGYCWYGNDEATYKNMYGALYNWYAVNVSSLCPSGWHVPNDAEWTILTNYLSKGDKVGGKLKDSGTTNWKIPNIGATNYSGFTALPGGYRFDDGTYTYLGSRVYLWSSTEYSISDAWNRYMLYSDANVYRLFSHKTNGLSVRCIKD